MKQTYVSHILVQSSPKWGPKTYAPGTIVWGPYVSPSIPTPISGSFEATTEWMRIVPSPKPNPSWDAVKRSGEIRMTPYEVEKVTTFNSLAARNDMAVLFRRTADFNSGVSPVTCAGIEFFEQSTSWREQGDYHYWSSKMGPPIELNSADIDLSSVIASTQTSAIASFKGGYDFLTEKAEARQGMQFLGETSAGVADIFRRFFTEHGEALVKVKRTTKQPTARDLLRSTDRKLRMAGSTWLALRYALMPMYYSYLDVKELIERSGISYQTYRESDTVNLEAPDVVGHLTGLYNVTSGSIRVNSTIKAKYGSDFLQDYVSNQVQWNPFATAWELVPLSFVLDWFVNVGDFIVASTSSDFSAHASGCTSVKTHVTVETVLRNLVAKEFSRSWPVLVPCQPTEVKRVVNFSDNVMQTCRTVVREHYVRTPFDLDAASIAFKPSMNWKRAVDAVALSHNSLRNLQRRFKK